MRSLTALVVVFLLTRAANAQDRASGSAHVDVTVTDRFGDSLPGATVKLTGVVDREAVTNDVGYVTFADLPEGRYDVVASLKRMSPSPPRVLDLPSFGITSVALTLKPYGPVGTISDSCGGVDARSIIGLSQNAQLIALVKVVDQYTLERTDADGNPRGYLLTVNVVQPLHSFRQNLRRPSLGSTLRIQQGGGRIDRGDYIDVHNSNDFPPLNVGDEYVLFVYVDETTGTQWISGAEEGAFRIRNGRVEPSGRGGAASSWRGRSASDFFAALSALR
jgi:hypothetical protein